MFSLTGAWTYTHVRVLILLMFLQVHDSKQIEDAKKKVNILQLLCILKIYLLYSPGNIHANASFVQTGSQLKGASLPRLKLPLLFQVYHPTAEDDRR